MKAVRTTIDAERLASIIKLPKSMRHQDVDVIILSKTKKEKKKKTNSEPETARGCLNKYAKSFPQEPEEDDHSDLRSIKGYLKEHANPALRKLEKGAWARAAAEKYLRKLKDELGEDEDDNA